MERYKEIERSIIKRFRKEIWAKFVKAVKDYKLINEGDKVMVCISGGKDSFLLAKCVEELKKHGGVNFDACYVCMNPGYNELNKQMILKNAKILNVDLEMFESDIFDVANTLNEKSPCYMCARMRRGYLYNKAKELGCNKIALGHHFDDVVETTLLSMFYGSEVKTMLPKLHSENFEGLELIRPLYLVKEANVLAWCKYNDLTFINCACKFTDRVSKSDEHISKRKEMKELIKKLREMNPDIDYNIFKAMDNVNLNCVLGTRKDGVHKSFMEDYDK
jgi:predicted ATPase of the PP-loop superfamily implicated in cell cycle control